MSSDEWQNNIEKLKEKYIEEGKELAGTAKGFKDTNKETYNFFMGQVSRTIDIITDLEEVLK